MLFITKYESGESTFGGMVRVKDIEDITINAEFLTINLKRPFHYSHSINENGNKVFNVGIFRFNKILTILKKHKSVYFHTIGNFIKLSPYLITLSAKKKFIDLHGAQPEELSYSNKAFLSFIFGFFERLAFKRCDVFIHVSQQMIKHFNAKYPGLDPVNLYVPIFSASINVDEKLVLQRQANEARKELQIFDDKPVFLYSGGIQAWQKSELVVDFSKSALDAGARVIILSMQKEYFKTALVNYKNNSNLLIASVKPEELSKYYLAANFGIMFRDDHVLNEVASPTKLSEYLFYGMVPILTSIKVGDFVPLGIEHSTLNSFSFNKGSFKSEKNREIIIHAMKNSQKDKLKGLLNE
jgi:hypothetical protein